jgi:hypothetical protein
MRLRVVLHGVRSPTEPPQILHAVIATGTRRFDVRGVTVRIWSILPAMIASVARAFGEVHSPLVPRLLRCAVFAETRGRKRIGDVHDPLADLIFLRRTTALDAH